MDREPPGLSSAHKAYRKNRLHTERPPRVYLRSLLQFTAL